MAFLDKQKLKEFTNIKPTLKEMFKGLLQVEKKRLQKKNLYEIKIPHW